MIVNNIHISRESFTGHVSSGGQDQNQKKAILKERQNTAVSMTRCNPENYWDRLLSKNFGRKQFQAVRVQLNTYAKVAKLQAFRAP